MASDSPSSSSSSSSSHRKRDVESSASGAKPQVKVEVELPKAEIKVKNGKSGDGKTKGAKKGGAKKANMSAAVTEGLNFKGAGNICISVGKILAIIAALLMFIAAFIQLFRSYGAWPSFLTFLLLCAFIAMLLIMDLISKPEVVLKFFRFIHFPAGVMASLLILSFQMFPWGFYGGMVGDFRTWAVVITWLIIIYLLIVTLLRAFAVF
eukprot:gnl/Chilomastix_caulleri/330.p1 GENE.gnl/Chilomastix_caulleri/330~~gnl/Chilomastix_caulleri/330.p1  ORF type:complete len:208 (+),score=53.16 gnl/Chilomastix_caulleri/330:120-743(+)